MTPRTATHRTLVIGYGNPGRADDGLGPAFAAALADRDLPGVTVEQGFQLAVEDAVRIAAHDLVLFVDAAREGPEPFVVRRVRPGRALSFSTHSVSPQAVLGLAREHFAARARGLLLAIRGYEFDRFAEGLTARARENLERALAAFFAGEVTDG